jgi:hypothetical protein
VPGGVENGLGKITLLFQEDMLRFFNRRKMLCKKMPLIMRKGISIVGKLLPRGERQNVSLTCL